MNSATAVNASRESVSLTAEMLIPELLKTHPEARPVLDRHGLRGCGGALGPHESIRFFAKAHGVEEDRLLEEIRAAIAAGPKAEPPAQAANEPEPVSPTIYRRFFLGAIALTLTAGATWGAWMLWRIGLGGSFEGAGLHPVNAHGQAQVFGWVGLFIMGFAYQAFPRFWRTQLAMPRLAGWVFGLMVLGVVLRTIGMTTGGATTPTLAAAMIGGGLQLVAVGLFSSQIVLTYFQKKARWEPSAAFILTALVWFVGSTALSVWHSWNTMTAGSTPELIWYVATYQAPLRDLQIHGLALFMIFGVSLRLMPALFDLAPRSSRSLWIAYGLLVAGVLGEVGLFLTYRWTGNHWFAAGLMGPWIFLTAGVLSVLLPWRFWKPFPVGDRSAKFIRAAFGWLCVSLAMLLLTPVYQRLSGLSFSHAYHGAVRHAITVGFVSMMIVGMASRVVPTLKGFDPSRLSALWGPFLLINLGCALRVALQTWTDWTPRVFPWIGVSGTLEVAGLAWWGLGLSLLMTRPSLEPSRIVAPPRVARPGGSNLTVSESDRVGAVIERVPGALEVFLNHGFEPLRNPVLRRTLAGQVTIAQAAKLQGIDIQDLLRDLNAIAARATVAPNTPTVEANR